MNKYIQITNLLTEIINEKFDAEPIHVEGLDWSDNFSEMLEKLIIIHIRCWKIEDRFGELVDPKEIAELKKKLDFIFKVKRPQLIKAMNCYLDTYISENRSLKEENIKTYKGY